MSLSISSRLPSFRLPETSLPTAPSFSGSTPSVTDPSASSELLSNLFQDSFNTDSASGFGDVSGAGGKEQLVQVAQELIKTLEQLTELLQAPELGGEDASAQGPGGAGGGQGGGCSKSADGGGGGGGAGGVGGPQGPGGAGGVEGAGKAPEGQVGDWIKEAQKVLAANGIPADKMKAEDIAKIIEHESSGNPNAINLTDQNAKDGHPSKGLMQTIDSTFNAYKAPGHDNVYNPVDNIVAAVRYAVDKYGSVSNVPGLQAMNSGGGYVGY